MEWILKKATKFKIGVYNIVIRFIMLYTLETLFLFKKQEVKCLTKRENSR